MEEALDLSLDRILNEWMSVHSGKNMYMYVQQVMEYLNYAPRIFAKPCNSSAICFISFQLVFCITMWKSRCDISYGHGDIQIHSNGTEFHEKLKGTKMGGHPVA